MGDNSAIEWTDATWNPVTGCSKVSPGCAHCYAETFALTRLKGKAGYTGLPWTPENAATNVALHEDRIEQPMRWRRPRRIFVNSLSDLFHPLVPDIFLSRLWQVMEQADHHTYQVLTKRPERMLAFTARQLAGRAQYAADFESCPTEAMRHSPAAREAREAYVQPAEHIWLGTSIENDRYSYRARTLALVPAAVRFLSCEPLLGPLPSLNLEGIGWVIVGGESGPGARPMHSAWVRDIRDRCVAAGVPFLFKQWGAWQRGSEFRDDAMVMSRDGRLVAPEDVGRVFLRDDPATLGLEYIRRTTKHHAGRELDGRTWDEYPAMDA